MAVSRHDEGVPHDEVVIAVDRVTLLDSQGAVARTWPIHRGELSPYEELVLAGIQVAWDTRTRWQHGHADTITLLIDPAAGEVLVRTSTGTTPVVDQEIIEQVLTWYGAYIDDAGCE